MSNLTGSGASPRRRLLALAGFMGSGKTTVGSLLARQLAWRFVDLDSLIEEASGLRITEIFERLGEPVFRKIEREQLDATLARAVHRDEPTVLALGGGTFAQPGVSEVLRANYCTVIWLDCPPELLFSRCATVTGRPLFRDEASFRELYEQRLPFYRQADFRIQGGQASAQIIEQIFALGILNPGLGPANLTVGKRES